MKIDKDEVLRIAELAKIDIKEEDIERYQKNLSNILDFVSSLDKLPELSEKEYRQIMRKERSFQKDEEHGKMTARGQGLIGQAPRTKDGFVVSPHILKDKES